MEHYLTYYHNSSLSLKNFLHFPKSKRTHFEKISYISPTKNFLIFRDGTFQYALCPEKKSSLRRNFESSPHISRRLLIKP